MSGSEQQRLIEELDAAARGIDAAIAGLDDEKASRRGAEGWSVKDHLTHLTFWHEMRYFEVRRIVAGGRASFPVTSEEGVAAINDQVVANRRQLPFAQAVADLAFAREQVKTAVSEARAERLIGGSFEEIGPIGAGHEIDHAGFIEALRKEQGI